jgi:hypothetical protein
VREGPGRADGRDCEQGDVDDLLIGAAPSVESREDD